MHVCVLSHFSCVRLFATPWTVTCQAPLSMESSRREYWNGLPCPPPGDLPSPTIKPRSPALLAYSLPSEPTGKPLQRSSLASAQDLPNPGIEPRSPAL